MRGLPLHNRILKIDCREAQLPGSHMEFELTGGDPILDQLQANVLSRHLRTNQPCLCSQTCLNVHVLQSSVVCNLYEVVQEMGMSLFRETF